MKLRTLVALALITSASAGAQSTTLIDFELGATCHFVNEVNLTTQYATSGVIFSGGSPTDGGGALDECANFGISALSGTNYLAFSTFGTLSNGGTPVGPETITFASPASHVSIQVGAGGARVFQMDAYDSTGTLVGVGGAITTTGVWFTLDVSAASISSVVVSEISGGNTYVMDDLCFDTADHFIGTPYCNPANVNSSGSPAHISAFGSDVATDNNVLLHASELPVNQFGYFILGDAQIVFMPPGSQGNLCVFGNLGRYTSSLANSGAAGEFSFQLDLPNTPVGGGTIAIQAGQTWNFQAWFRDTNPNNTSNFTNAIGITFN